MTARAARRAGHDELPVEGRLVAIDLGEVRIGVAVSDPMQTIASPAETVEVPRGQERPAVDAVVEVVRRYEATGVVVGWPRRLDAGEGPVAQRSRRIAAAVRERTGLPVTLVDERFTTTEAERVMLQQDASRAERRASLDRVAAGVLLQTVLERQRRRRVEGSGAGGA